MPVTATIEVYENGEVDIDLYPYRRGGQLAIYIRKRRDGRSKRRWLDATVLVVSGIMARSPGKLGRALYIAARMAEWLDRALYVEEVSSVTKADITRMLATYDRLYAG
jgi:hypothetical protein